MATSMQALAADLAAETEVLDRTLATLSDEMWLIPTPAPGWTIRDQVAHLAYFDEAALTSLLDPDRFRAHAAELLALGGDFADRLVRAQRGMSRSEVYAWFRSSRHALIAETRHCEPSVRVAWYGPQMSLASSVTARLMETWAHGHDIADALGLAVQPTARLKHVAHLGFRAMPFSFQVRGHEVPTAPIRVELTGADDTLWTWGAEDAYDRVTGTALDFCLVVTQRRHRDDTKLAISGPVANEWMSIAQAFAGPPGSGRERAAALAAGAKAEITTT